jgi:hypothetical protein
MAMKLTKRFLGLHAHRLEVHRDNPTERVAALKWADQHPQPASSRPTGILPYLLGDGMSPVEPTDREWLVAATLMQWLGSPVGRNFVDELVTEFQKLDGKRK